MRCHNARFHMGMGGGGVPSDCPEGGWGMEIFMFARGYTPISNFGNFKISPAPFRSAHEDADL